MSPLIQSGRDHAPASRARSIAPSAGDNPGGADSPPGRSPLAFFVLTFALTIPFLVISAQAELFLLPGLPIAALMAVCPAAAAMIVVRLEQGPSGPANLLKRAFDQQRIRGRIWYVPILLLYPCIAALSYGVLRLGDADLPPPQIGLLTILAACPAFFVAALGEELGWSGYATDPLQSRWGPLRAALVLGAVWALLHVVALTQAHRSATWIAWWSLYTVAARVIMIWLYNNTGGSVFGAALFHTSLNVAWLMFSVDSARSDYRASGCITAIAAAIIVTGSGPRSWLKPGCPKRRRS